MKTRRKKETRKMKTDHKNWLKYLHRIGACDGAFHWVMNNKYSMKQSWDNCYDFGWLSELLCRRQVTEGWPKNREILSAFCYCVEPFTNKIVAKYKQPIQTALVSIRDWADRKITPDEVRRAQTEMSMLVIPNKYIYYKAKTLCSVVDDLYQSVGKSRLLRSSMSGPDDALLMYHHNKRLHKKKERLMCEILKSKISISKILRNQK